MESLTSGTLAGAGSFRCETCGHVVTLTGAEALAPCPQCSSRAFTRASLFAAGRFRREEHRDADERTALVRQARELIAGGAVGGATCHLAYDEGDGLELLGIVGETTRIGRSLTAELRFDDPTVSRRHALLVMDDRGVRVLDDRSLNGVFVNGQRIDQQTLTDGDEVVVGRHRLHFLDAATAGLEASAVDLNFSA